MKFYITKHCRERYIERVLSGNNTKDNILLSILAELKSGTNITSKISEEYPRLILYLKERYENKGFNFIKKDHTLYVLVKRKGTQDLYDVITCYIEGPQLEMFKNTVLSNEEIHLKLKLLKSKNYSI